MVAEAARSPLPPRYLSPWQKPFDDAIQSFLQPGMSILDVGGGRNPALPCDRRPPGTFYVGLDPSVAELHAAPAGSYSRTIAAHAEDAVPDLAGTIDLVVSWQVFEHVRSLTPVFDNLRLYLRPGGALVSLFSGRWAAYAIVNRLLPHRAAFPLVMKIGRRRRHVNPIFNAFYDHCSDRGIRSLTEAWSAVELVPLFRGATYFNFSPVFQRVYLIYENAAYARNWQEFATHYLLIATP